MPVKKMQVLQIGKYYYPYRGGIESSMHTLTRELKDRVSFAVLAANTRCKTVIEKYEAMTIIRLARFGTVLSQPLTPTLAFWMGRFKPDIVHMHLPNPLAVVSYLIARPAGKLIVSYHSDIVRQKALGPFFNLLSKKLLTKAAAIVATSENLIESSPILKEFRDKCCVIPHGIDTNRFKITPEIEEGAGRIRKGINRPVILFVGRLVYYKGLQYLIPAMKEVEAQLMILGDGPMRPKLHRLAESLHLENKITWASGVPDEALPAYYHACDLFILPSCCKSEAFGLTMLEAQACGKAVISTDLPTGVAFVNAHGKTGLIVPPGKSSSLARAINNLLGSKELLEEYGRNAGKRVEAEFTKEIMADKFLALYRKVHCRGL